MTNFIKILQRIIKTAFLFIFIFGCLPLLAQENPPIPIKVEVRTARNLNFGSFVVDPLGGNITVDHSSTLTNSTDVYPIGSGAVSSALFDVYANPGTIIHIPQQENTRLTNGNGGEIFLEINSLSTQDRTFVTWEPTADIPNEIYIGGTLYIPADNAGNIPGHYNGTFTLTFIHQ